MSLLKQLLISVSVALLGILVGSLAFNLDAARSYLSEQLYMESENAVSALALSLSQPANQDPVAQELLMSALFDTGHFQSVRMKDPEGEILFLREQTVGEQTDSAMAVPQWFKRLMPLPTSHAERAVSNGWSQLGTVDVRVNNRLAQTALWQSSLKMSMLIVVAGIAWGLFVVSLIRWFRRVLHEEIAAQVRHIGTSADMHSAQPSGSQLQELNAISSAIADTHVRVQQAEKAQLQRIESLELETNCDPLTLLPNRKYFLNELNKKLCVGSGAYGHVLLFRLRDLQALNSSYSRNQVNEWLRGVTQQVQTLLQSRAEHEANFARLNGSDFAVLLPQMHSLVAMQEVEHLRKLLQSLSLALHEGQWSRWAFALTPYAHGEAVSDVLARLDQGLMYAESAGHGEVEYAEASAQYRNLEQVGESQWQQVLTQALAHPEQFMLDVQPVMSASLIDTKQRFEATMELHGQDGKVLRASLFVPAAVRLGYMDEIDLKAVELGLAWLQIHPQQTLVVRISLVSLQQSQFTERLQALLQLHAAKQVLDYLVLELDAHALETCADNVQQLCAVVSSFGMGVGLRRLDQSPKALLQLMGLPLRYVKLGGFFAEQGLHNPGAQHLVEAMLSTALAQGTAVYITESVAPGVAGWLRLKGASLLVPSGG